MSEALNLFEAGLLSLGYKIHDQHDPVNVPLARKALVMAVKKDRTIADAWLALLGCGQRSLQVYEYIWRGRDKLGKHLGRYGYVPVNIKDFTDAAKPKKLIYDSGVMITAPIKDADSAAAAYVAALASATEYDKAAELFEDKLDDYGPLTRYQAGCMYFRTQNWVDVIDAVKPLADDTSEPQLCAAARILTVVASANLGLNTTAIKLAVDPIAGRTPAQILPDGSSVLDYYSAMSHRALGNVAEANELLRAVLVSTPDFPGAEAALANPEEQLAITSPAHIAARTDRWNPASAPTLVEMAAAANPIDREAILAEADKQLDQFIGLEGVKDQVRRLKSRVRINAIRAKRKEPELEGGRHLVFAGPPGTGKTTIGRVVAKIYCGLGLLATDKVREVRREDLVGQHIGETEAKTNAVIDDALDGVLIIDEAYALVSPGMKNDFGLVAINTLLARMENDRDRLIVIAMGYGPEMEMFKSANDGLRSRFSRTIDFPNYEPAELAAIAKLRARSVQMSLDAAGFKILEDTCTVLCNRTALVPPKGDEKEGSIRRVIDIVGNARFIRNVLEAAVDYYTYRLDEAGADDDVDDDVLTTFSATDLRRGLETALGKEFAGLLAA